MIVPGETISPAITWMPPEKLSLPRRDWNSSLTEREGKEATQKETRNIGLKTFTQKDKEQIKYLIVAQPLVFMSPLTLNKSHAYSPQQSHFPYGPTSMHVILIIIIIIIIIV